VKRLSLPELAEVGSQKFLEIVFNAVKREVRTAILELVRREREGEQVDKHLIKSVIEIFVEMGGSRASLETCATPPAKCDSPRSKVFLQIPQTPRIPAADENCSVMQPKRKTFHELLLPLRAFHTAARSPGAPVGGVF